MRWVSDRKLNDVLRAAVERGWRLERRRRRHLMCFAPDGRNIVTVSDSDDPRAIKNVVADFRRAGLKID